MTRLLRVGLSATLLMDPASRHALDGIGVYTQALGQHLPRCDGITVLPMVMGALHARDVPDGTLRYPGPTRWTSLLAALPWQRPASAATLRAAIDVYFATDYRIPRTTAVPVCATLHDAIPLSHPQWANPRLRTLKNLLLRRSARWAQRVITVSQAMVPALCEQFGIPQARIAVTPLGVDERWYVRDRAEVVAAMRARYALPAGYFLFVGTLQPRKNVERIVAAYAALPAAVRAAHQLVIVGKSGWRAETLVAALRAGNAEGRVRWLERVADADLRPLFAAASAFVFPSLYEGFGLPVLEAFASGTPVVTSNVTSLPEVAGDAALQVDPLRVDAIADAMRRVVEDHALAASLVVRGSARARTFTWDKCAALTAQALRDTVG